MDEYATFTNKHGVTITRKRRCKEVIRVNGQPTDARKPGDPGYIDLLRHLFNYDPETGVITRRVKMNRSGAAGYVVGVPLLGYLRATVLRQNYGCHRIAWALHYGEWPDMHLDHINGIRTDNRIVNLREVTTAQNSFNSSLSKRSASGIKGVSWSVASGKWQGYVGFENTRHHVGFFDNLTDADAAVRTAREVLHGQYARHR